MIPITRKENYLNEIVGWGETAPEKPLTPEEFFFAAILGEAVQTPEPLSRYQIYLAKIAGRNISVPKPSTRLELFLAKACGMDIETPTPITREEIFWSNYTAIVEFEVEGVPPLTFNAVAGTLKNYRIYGNTVNGESVGDLVESGEHAGEYKVPVTTERSVPHTATLQLHDCLPSTIQFDAAEALYYAENGLTAGTYNFTIQDYETAYGGGKTYQFTLANDVPAKGQLVFGWAYNTQASAAKITSYASSTSTTAIEQVGVTEGSGGTSLGTTDGNSTNVNHIHRARYGSNNYKESAIRQFLNSSAVAGSVWTPQTKYDRPPSWNSNTAGFMKDIDSDFLAALGASPKVVALNTVTDGGGSVTINNDKFFLLSRSEVYGGKENNINEGEPYPYYSNYSDLSAADEGYDSNRIKYRSGTAKSWWLRSPFSAYGGYVRLVDSDGGVDLNYVLGMYTSIAPACNIALDEDYKFNGRVLHVRDQISVQKGNQTLVFDVIGIDHDEVHFDKTTVDIYLPEPIKMVGDEAEYIDCAEQKMHRVRKNLFSSRIEQGSFDGITGVPNNSSTRVRSHEDDYIFLTPGVYKISAMGVEYFIVYAYDLPDINAFNYNLSRTSWEPLSSTITINTSAYYKFGFCKANNPIITPSDVSNIMLNTGSTALPYEPYIENVDLDVTLPALPTLTGTNVLSVGTAVQPSKVYVKYKGERQ